MFIIGSNGSVKEGNLKKTVPIVESPQPPSRLKMCTKWVRDTIMEVRQMTIPRITEEIGINRQTVCQI